MTEPAPKLIAIRYERRLVHTGFRVENKGTPEEQTIPIGRIEIGDGTVIEVDDLSRALSVGEWTILEETP